MKKILAILASLGLTATAGLSVVACGKSNTQFNNFMNYVNETKGSYDDQGQPKTKSSASVIYLGAKDNASSQSFEYALTKTFGSIDLAKTALNQETKIDKTRTYSLTKEIIDNTITLSTNDTRDLLGSDKIKVEIEEGNNWISYDADITPSTTNNYINIEKTVSINKPATTKIKLTGYKLQKQTTTLPTKGADVISGWNVAYNQWLTQKNDDRSVSGINLNLDTKSKKFGKVSATNVEPVYGIKGNSETGLTTTAWDYAKIKFSLKTLTVDKISDYWNNDLFKKLAEDYLKKDLMYQLAANNDPIVNGNQYLTWQPAIQKYMDEIKSAKGPLFLIVKNGHVIKIMKGWTRYSHFSNKIGDNDPDTIYETNLIQWVNQMQTIFGQSFKDNNNGLFGIGSDKQTVDVWNFAVGRDDEGKSNWDPKKEKATD